MSTEEKIAEKMRRAGQPEEAIQAFLANMHRLRHGENGMMPEGTLRPIESLPRLEELPQVEDADGFMARLVVIKLNGGLGTSMGLDRAKSLIPVKGGLSFLDLIARQILHLRAQTSAGLRLLFMNSFATSRDTLDFLKKYPELGAPSALEFLQSMAPKLYADSLEPATCSENPDLEWCPPGHGDLYAAIGGSGHLDVLLASGVEYAFVSNSDNLGATPDLRIAAYMEKNNIPFLMEVTRRTHADSKGGHLAMRLSDGRLVLRESAQCPAEDRETFQDTGRHRFFNTNNLWLRLDRLKEMLGEEGGSLPLPFIRNEKTLDPQKSDSPRVIQIETAMGAAIELFPGAAALDVPRTRFAPVKKTNDLLVLRSDVTEVRPDWTLGLIEARGGMPPEIKLSDHYKLLADFDRLVTSPPSLVDCECLEVDGEVGFHEPVAIHGHVAIRSSAPCNLPGREYRDEIVSLA